MYEQMELMKTKQIQVKNDTDTIFQKEMKQLRQKNSSMDQSLSEKLLEIEKLTQSLEEAEGQNQLKDKEYQEKENKQNEVIRLVKTEMQAKH